MARKKLVWLGIICLIILVVGAAWLWTVRPNSSGNVTPSTNGTPSNARQICPDAWYDNQMPGPAPGETDTPSQYFIVDGARVELDELDVAWIKTNCSVNEPLIVE